MEEADWGAERDPAWAGEVVSEAAWVEARGLILAVEAWAASAARDWAAAALTAVARMVVSVDLV